MKLYPLGLTGNKLCLENNSSLDYARDDSEAVFIIRAAAYSTMILIVYAAALLFISIILSS